MMATVRVKMSKKSLFRRMADFMRRIFKKKQPAQPMTKIPYTDDPGAAYQSDFRHRIPEALKMTAVQENHAAAYVGRLMVMRRLVALKILENKTNAGLSENKFCELIPNRKLRNSILADRWFTRSGSQYFVNKTKLAEELKKMEEMENSASSN